MGVSSKGPKVIDGDSKLFVAIAEQGNEGRVVQGHGASPEQRDPQRIESKVLDAYEQELEKLGQ
jgi:DNA-binding cell septation regulator SpoVG